MDQSPRENGEAAERLSPRTPLGELEGADAGWRLRFVRHLPHPPERVWRALTEPAELDAWFPTTIEGERKTGSVLTFRFREDQAPPFEGELIVYEPPRLLEFTWGADRLRIELEPTQSGTRLTLLNGFDELGKAARDAAGWHVCLDSLEHDLDSSDQVPTTWTSVYRHYVHALGPAATTIGPPPGMP